MLFRSDEEANDATNFGVHSPKFVLPLGVDPPEMITNAPTRLRQRYHLSKDALIFLFLSRLHEKKRPDFLLEVFANLELGDRDFHLLVAGTGNPSYCYSLQEKVNSLGIADKVTFTGFVTGFDKNLLLQGADIFALPSYSENFGIAVVEALASGLPVVITPDVQIAPQIEAAGAGLVVPGELQSWCAAITKLVAATNLRVKFAEQGKYLAQTCYSWPSISQKLASHYEDIVSKHV